MILEDAKKLSAVSWGRLLLKWYERAEYLVESFLEHRNLEISMPATTESVGRLRDRLSDIEEPDVIEFLGKYRALLWKEETQKHALESRESGFHFVWWQGRMVQTLAKLHGREFGRVEADIAELVLQEKDVQDLLNTQ